MNATAPPHPAPSRPTCARCHRPLRTCLCAWVRPVDNGLPLLLLQHPAEQHHARGSARLLQLSLARCRVEVGEAFDDGQLTAWLKPGAALLYPGAGPAAMPPGGPRQLVLLDGTWRQTRRLLQANPRLQVLQRVGLPAAADLPPARHIVRRPPQPQQRSTLEAALLALRQWEPATDMGALLEAFDAWVAQQQGFIPRR